MVSTLRDGREKLFWRQPGTDSWSGVADRAITDPRMQPWFIDLIGNPVNISSLIAASPPSN